MTTSHHAIPFFNPNEERTAQAYEQPQVERPISSNLLNTIEIVENNTEEDVEDSTQKSLEVDNNPNGNSIDTIKVADTSLSKLEGVNNLVDIEVPFRIELETADGDIQTITIPHLGTGNNATILTDEEVAIKSFSESTTLTTDILPTDTNAKSNHELYTIDNVTAKNPLKAIESPTKYKNDEINQSHALSSTILPVTHIAENKKYSLLRSNLASRRKRKKVCRLSRNQNEIDIIESHCNQGSLSFMPALKWLAGITEYINETMHYGCSGKPEPLIFQAPHEYFELLRSRISEACLSGKCFKFLKRKYYTVD